MHAGGWGDGWGDWECPGTTVNRALGVKNLLPLMINLVDSLLNLASCFHTLSFLCVHAGSPGNSTPLKCITFLVLSLIILPHDIVNTCEANHLLVVLLSLSGQNP